MKTPHDRTLTQHFWFFVKAYWLNTHNKLSWLFASCLIGLGLGVVKINVLINEWSKKFWDTLTQVEKLTGNELTALIGNVYDLLQTYLIYIAIFVLCQVYRAWFRKLIIIRWRTHLTNQLMENWFDRRAYYRLALAGNVDNPDQRIQDDVNIFVARTLELTISFITNVTQLFAFLAVLWQLSGVQTFALFGREWTVHGYLVWVALLYSLFGSIFTQAIGKRLHALNFQQQKFEADFRASLLKKSENAEAIALYQGENVEKTQLKQLFTKISDNWRTLMNKERDLGFFVTAYDRFSSLLPVIVSIPLLLAKAITIGSLMQIRGAFSSVFNAFSWFVFAYSILPEWSATLKRLGEFRVATEAMSNKDKAQENSDNSLILKDLSLFTPDGTPILSNINLSFALGKWTHLQGKSGLGKSTLLRVIGGLWADYTGQVARPDGRHLLLPQRPYIGQGTLKELLSYPNPVTADDDHYLTVLDKVGLGEHKSALNHEHNFASQLSLGEQQRLAIGRAILARPDFLYLDESVSSLDKASATALFELLKAELPTATVIVVSHQDECVLGQTIDVCVDLQRFV